ncbi:NERD domain-containing protein [Rhodococcus sp. AD45]|uniref:NERD domain-containing protein n=1 Tax=Rhodococcus sp. (strain AD45) TaxID=103808 RepID=UPI0013922C6A|nr:NERD domain-containing protein [Rhodococcus sp. AD45]
MGLAEDPGLSSAAAPFSLTALAGAVAIDGNDRRQAAIDISDIENLCSTYIELDHPEVPTSGPVDTDALAAMTSRIIHSQFPFGYSIIENIGRSVSLFVDRPDVRNMPSQDQWREQLGVDILDYLRIVMGLLIPAARNKGVITAPLLREKYAVLFTETGVETAITLLNDHLSSDIPSLEAHGSTHRIQGQEMWSPNPLTARPFVRYGSEFVLPSFMLLEQKMTPLGMYFTGLELFGASTFPGAVGDAFELHVGEQLRELEYAVIHSEIEYRDGKDKKKTVDFIVEFEELILLVEVKAARTIATARAGLPDGLANTAAKMNSARRQIDNTAILIRGRKAELSHIACDRPIRGLVVTLEPNHLVDTFLFEERINATDTEIATACGHDIERIIPVLADREDVGRRLLKALTKNGPTPPSIDRAVSGISRSVRNRLVDERYERAIRDRPVLR